MIRRLGFICMSQSSFQYAFPSLIDAFSLLANNGLKIVNQNNLVSAQVDVVHTETRQRGFMAKLSGESGMCKSL